MGQAKGFLGTSGLLFWQIGLTLLSAALYAMSSGHPLSLAPLALVPLYLIGKKLGLREKPEQDILLSFMAWSFIVDDISQVAWGRELDTWTEALGASIFQSFGITGMEAFIFAFAAWILLRVIPKERENLAKLGFFSLAIFSLSVFALSLISGWLGVNSGGDWKTMFIQIRFLHALPIWVAIGFIVWRDIAFTEKVLKWLTILVTLKSAQALFVYASNRSLFAEAEYLVDHYYSGFAVVGMIGLLYYAYTSKKLAIKILNLIGMPIIAYAYLLNDRRTSYVGVIFTLAVLPCLLPWLTIKRYAIRGLIASSLLAAYIAATWTLPPPLGFVGHLYRSFGSETETKAPSYRELENANLFHAISQNPSLGIGYGKEFDEVYPMPDISTVYERYRMIPHNSFLASWAFGGPQTFAALSLIFVLMISAAAKLLRASKAPILILLALMSLAFSLQYLTYTFGDLGFQIMRNQMLAGLFLGACIRLRSDILKVER